MIGETLLMNRDPDELRSELIKAMDTVIADSLRAFGIQFNDPQELKGRLGKKRQSDWEPGRYQYFIDGHPFLDMRYYHNPQTVRLSWVTIAKKEK